jgi:choline dehydrogenase
MPTDPLLDEVLAAGAGLGWATQRDLNETDEDRLGYATATIRGGRRVTAATAFLHPVANRRNLTVVTETLVDRVLLENGRAVGVAARDHSGPIEYHATRSVVLAAGALASPGILQRSGIGPAEALRAAGVGVVVDSPNVGARMREHQCVMLQFRLAEDLGNNRWLGSATGRMRAGLRYLLTRRGPLATAGFDLVGFFRTRPDLERPDAQFQVAPMSLRPDATISPERAPGMMAIGFVLRPDSEGSVHITSPDPGEPPQIVPDHFTTANDRRVGADLFRTLRRLFATEPLAKRVEHETVPGPAVQDDDEIIEAALTQGSCGYHAIGTCAMGPADDDVVDHRLRVRGLTGLRVIDASVLPIMVSGNLNGPVSALAWRAADVILEDS